MKFLQQVILCKNTHILYDLGLLLDILKSVNNRYRRDSNFFVCFQLNASDDRGIGIVREQVLGFASTRTVFKYVVFNPKHNLA